MPPPNLPEKIFLALCICASLIAFWARFRHVVEILRASKSDPGFRFGSLAPRVRDFVWEVLLQGKVIRQRPLAGAAHAFVFWGFCAFALITLNHLATGFGSRSFRATAASARSYFGFVAVFAVAVAVSICYLAVRRFVARPDLAGQSFAGIRHHRRADFHPDGHLSGGAGRCRRTRSRSASFWWMHTLALLIFLPLIPHTKHLHLVLSPATVFLKRDGFSDIPPLAGDEDFGLVTGKDVTRIDALQAFSCVECGRCTEHCPGLQHRQGSQPEGNHSGTARLSEQGGPGVGERRCWATHISEEAVFQCTTCGACEFQCPVGIQHLPMIIGLRRGAVNTGTWEDAYGTKLFLTLERNGNSLGIAVRASARSSSRRTQLPIYDGTQEYCLWLGCMGAYDPPGREIILALVKVLRIWASRSAC